MVRRVWSMALLAQCDDVVGVVHDIDLGGEDLADGLAVGVGHVDGNGAQGLAAAFEVAQAGHQRLGVFAFV